LLRQATDLRHFGVEDFRHWLTHQLSLWRKDPVFAQRARIRDLRQAHPELLDLERACRHAATVDAASAQFPRLQQLETELSKVGKALSGLRGALARAAPDKRPALERKLADFEARQRLLTDEEVRLIHASGPRRELRRLHAELHRLRLNLGLEQAEARLAESLRQQGQRSGHSGEAFEELAESLTWRLIVPDLLRRAGDTARQRVCVLRGVTLGAARTELDQLVIRRSRTPEGPVEVLALVEVKRNINDLAHGFRQRQENLAWLTGDAAHYDPRQYRTRYFHTGHFDREAVHEEGGERFILTCGSFRRFQREPDSHQFLKRLYLITRVGMLAGVSASALARIRHRVATDERWQPEREAYLRSLLHWCQSLAEPLEAPDVLRLYGSTPRRARQVLVVTRKTAEEPTHEQVVQPE
jgi:hypothetical protein